MRRLFAVLVLLAALPAGATPRAYRLDSNGSIVAFGWDFGPDAFEGRMTVAEATLALDFDDVAASRVQVAVDVASAEAGFGFASEALKGPRVLDAASYPRITFVSSDVARTGPAQARITGTITIRGVARPMTFDAAFSRGEGAAPADLSDLAILLTGQVSRSAFGASGWSDLVGDTVRLRILARIRAAE